MQFKKSTLHDYHEIQPRVITDTRGRFVKTFHRDLFVKSGFTKGFSEVYYSQSRKGVLRGLHFQTPPFDHEKLVYCVQGQVLDVAVDLRVGSPTFGQFASCELTSVQGNMVYLGAGLAHGFYTLSEDAVVVCQMTNVYEPDHDAGIRWDSVDFNWPDQSPMLSERDQELPLFADFASPFVFDTELLRGGNGQ